MLLDRFRLDDRVAVVTAAGRGIGAASALALAESGADVVIAARTTSQLDDVAAQVEKLGRRAVVVPADLSDLGAVEGLVDVAVNELGRLDIVVSSEPLHDEMVSKTPLRRLGDADDIALAVLYLASDASSYVTGKILEVDGGIEASNLDMHLPDL